MAFFRKDQLECALEEQQDGMGLASTSGDITGIFCKKVIVGTLDEAAFIKRSYK